MDDSGESTLFRKKTIATENKKKTVINKIFKNKIYKRSVASHTAPVLVPLLEKLPDRNLHKDAVTSQEYNADKIYSTSFVKSLLEDQPLLQPIVKRRTKSISATCNNISKRTTETIQPSVDCSINNMDKRSSSCDRGTDGGGSLNDNKRTSKKLGIKEILETIIGVSCDQIHVDVHDKDGENGIILKSGDTMDPENTKETRGLELKTKINTVAGVDVDEQEIDNVVDETKEHNKILTTETTQETMNVNAKIKKFIDNKQTLHDEQERDVVDETKDDENTVTTETIQETINVNAEIERSSENNQTLNTGKNCAMQSYDGGNVTETDTFSSLVLENPVVNIEATPCFTINDADFSKKYEGLAKIHVDLTNQEECLIKNPNTNFKDALLEHSCETVSPLDLPRENKKRSKDCIVVENAIKTNISNTDSGTTNFLDMAEVIAVISEPKDIGFSDATVNTSMKNFRSENTTNQLVNISSSDKGVIPKEHYVGDKGISYCIEDRIKNNKLNEQNTPTIKCIADSKPLTNKLDSIKEALQISNLENLTKLQLSDKTADMVKTEGSKNVKEFNTCTLVQTYPVGLGIDNTKTSSKTSQNPTKRRKRCKGRLFKERLNDATSKQSCLKKKREINRKKYYITHNNATIYADTTITKEKVATAVRNISVVPINVQHNKQNNKHLQQEKLSTTKLTEVLHPTSNIVEKTITNQNDKFIHSKVISKLSKGQITCPTHRVQVGPIATQTFPSAYPEYSKKQMYCKSKTNTNIDTTLPLVNDVVGDGALDSDDEDLGQDIILEQVNAVIAKLDEQIMPLENVSNNTVERKFYEEYTSVGSPHVYDNVPQLEIGKDKNGKTSELNPTRNQMNLSADNCSYLKETGATDIWQEMEKNIYNTINKELPRSKDMITKMTDLICEADDRKKECPKKRLLTGRLDNESVLNRSKRAKIVTRKEDQIIDTKTDNEERVTDYKKTTEDCVKVTDLTVQKKQSNKESSSLESASVSKKKTVKYKNERQLDKTFKRKALDYEKLVGNKVLRIVLERLPKTTVKNFLNLEK